MNLSITNECNRRCEYCFQKSWYLANKKENIKEMSLETIEKIINMTPEHMSHIKILGGEPLLYSNIFELFEIFKNHKKYITFISNITIDNNKFKTIVNNYNDVISSWLINTDYPEQHKKIFKNNLSLLKKCEDISFSTTLLPNTNKIIQSANRILDLLELLNNKDNISIRVSPMSPNHINKDFYEYSLDIIKFIELIWSKGLRTISFDCPLNSCEIHPELFNMFDRNSNYIDYTNKQCSGCGAFDILVDNSVIYCSSTYNTIRLENIFDYDSIESAQRAMHLQWKKYWKNNKMNCEYKTCEYFNPAYCQGLCPAKNIIKSL